MSENWQVYEKRGNRWEAVLEPRSKQEAEMWVSVKWAALNAYEKAVAEAKKAGKRNRHPDPGFREPHCVPV